MPSPRSLSNPQSALHSESDLHPESHRDPVQRPGVITLDQLRAQMSIGADGSDGSQDRAFFLGSEASSLPGSEPSSPGNVSAAVLTLDDLPDPADAVSGESATFTGVTQPHRDSLDARGVPHTDIAFDALRLNDARTGPEEQNYGRMSFNDKLACWKKASKVDPQQHGTGAEHVLRLISYCSPVGQSPAGKLSDRAESFAQDHDDRWARYQAALGRAHSAGCDVALLVKLFPPGPPGWTGPRGEVQPRPVLELPSTPGVTRPSMPLYDGGSRTGVLFGDRTPLVASRGSARPVETAQTDLKKTVRLDVMQLPGEPKTEVETPQFGTTGGGAAQGGGAVKGGIPVTGSQPDKAGGKPAPGGRGDTSRDPAFRAVYGGHSRTGALLGEPDAGKGRNAGSGRNG